MKYALTRIIGAAILPLALACSVDTAADLIITNAAVYTLAWPEPSGEGVASAGAPFDSATGWHPDAQAIVVSNGLITFVGDTAGAMKLRGASTRVIDARGATVLPGLVDSHVHLANLGASLARVDLVGVTTEDEVIRRVEERAARTPEGEWIIGYGWDEGAWANRYPDMKLLSERVPKHPVWLIGLHTFAGWGNNLAFERAMITAATTAPDGGEIRKNVAGEPTGILTNNAVRLMESAIPKPSAGEMDSRMSAALDAVARAGYTSVHDANTDSHMLASLERLGAAGKLPIRISAMLSAADSALIHGRVPRGADTNRTSMLRVYSVKAFYDGALGSRGALLLSDYIDRAGHRGRGGVDIGFSTAVVRHAVGRQGFQVAIHAIGDAANRETLNLLEALARDYPKSITQRHRIEHAQILAAEDIARFAALGVIASMQPGHAVEDKAWAEQRVGAERIRGGYAWRSLRKSGARMVLNSDMPGSSYDVFYMWHAAITRRDPELKPDGGWFPNERLTPEEAVRGFTTWAAYAAFTEKESGTLEVGKWADITMIDKDPFVLGSTAPEKLLGGRALLTVVNGKVVYEGSQR